MEDQKQKSTDYLYLEKLKFRPELRKTWLNFFVSNFRVVLMMIIFILAWGAYSYLQLPRESNPEVKIAIAVVITTYPGASPSDMEELVTKKLEAAIAGVKDVNKITSNSYNSVSSITVEFDAGANLDDSIRRLRDEVVNAKPDLPADANDPFVQEISFDDQPILILALTGPFDGFTMRRVGDELKDDIEKLPDVREVGVSGGDEREFEVAYDPAKLTFYNISADQANQVIKATNLTLPAGSFEGSEYTYPIRGDARFYDVAALGDLPVTHSESGAIVYLKDIAQVSEKAVKQTVYSRFSLSGSEPEPAVTLSVVKKTGGNIIKTIDQTKTIIDEKLKTLPPGFKYDVTLDFGKMIKTDFDQLLHDFYLTVFFVFTILFVLVGLKEALVAGMAVPLVFSISFGVMNQVGLTLNFLSIFSLLLSLGLLVDDAIVVVSATKQYMRTGKFTPEEAVLLVLNDFKVVLTTTTLTTVWAFLPLLLATGIIGEFLKSIPITVSVTLISSLLVALMINHPLAAVLERVRLTKRLFFFLLALLFGLTFLAISSSSLIGYALSVIFFVTILSLIRWYMRTGKGIMAVNAELMEKEWQDNDLIKKKLRDAENREGAGLGSRFFHGIFSINYVLPLYDKFLCRLLTERRFGRKALAVVAIIFIGAVAMPVTGILQLEFFPASDEDLVFINIRAATGLNLDETEKIVARAEAKLLRYPDIKNFSTVVGQQGFSNDLGGSANSSNLGGITLNMIDKDERSMKSYELADVLRDDFSDIKDAVITVESLQGGPPAGSAFEARIIGDDLQALDKIAHDLEPILASISGVVDTDISLKESPAEYTFTLDPKRLELYNLNAAYVGSILRLAIAGTEVSTVVLGGKEIKIIATFAADKIPDLEAIQNLQILNLRKQPVFLKDVAKIELKPSVNAITRIDQKRAVLLSAGVAGQTNPATVLSEFQKKMAANYVIPSGYGIVYGGENEQNTESVISILKAMALAGILIVATLVIQFNSFKEALIVLATIPLALIGVFYGLSFARISLSFPGLIGILALFGIVVKNAIILIDKINLNLKTGIAFEDAIIDAGKSRFEAIFITSISTIFGIIPITFSSELWRALGFSIIFGLMLSSFLTLFIIPMLYSIFMKKRPNRPLDASNGQSKLDLDLSGQ